MKKRLLSISIIIGILFLQGFSALAATPVTNSPDSIESTIIDQALALEQSANIEGKEFTVVELSQGSTDIDPLSDNSDVAERAIQAVSMEGDLIEVTTIFPYKVMPDGDLVNSFEYTPIQITRDSTNSTTFTDVTVTVVAYFAKYDKTFTNGYIFYRHGGIEAYWNSSNSTVKVSNMHVNFDSAGHLYQYPECTTADIDSVSGYLLERDYSIRSSIDQDSPVKGQSYFDGDHTMSRSNVLDCANYYEHGGLIYVKLTYSVSGKSHVHDRSYKVYGK